MRCSMIVGLWLVVCAVHAEQVVTERGLSLDQMLVRVLENNPELKSATFANQAMAARIRAARLTPPMSVNIELENFAGSGNYQGSDALESTLSLAKVFELGNKTDLRADVRQQEAVVFASAQDVKRLDLLAQAARQFVHIVVDQSRVTIAQDKLRLLRDSYQVVERRVKAGRSHVAERRRMAIAVARAEIELEHAEHELQTSRVKLATYWGAITPDFTSVHAELFDLKQVRPFAQLTALLEQNPALIRFASEQRLAEARVHLAEAKQSADVELIGGIRHFNSVDDTAFVLSARIPFGLSARAQPGIEEHVYMRSIRNWCIAMKPCRYCNSVFSRKRSRPCMNMSRDITPAVFPSWN